MLNLPLSPRWSLAPALLIVLCSVLNVLQPAATEWLGFDRQLILQYQWWRLLSANLLHTNLNHLLLNIAGVALLWALHGQYFSTWRYVAMLVLLSLGTTLSILCFSPQLQWYVGLSGILHGVFLLGAYADIRHGLRSGWLLVAGLLIKVAHEQLFGASDDIASLINASVAIDAHLYGSLSGLVLILAIEVLRRAKPSQSRASNKV